MSRNRTTLAIVFLVLSAIDGFVGAPILLSRHDHRPPTLIPILILIFALASLAAAYGLRQRASWAIPLGIGSRALDTAGATFAFFSDVGNGGGVGAAIVIAISLVTIALLLSVRREQTLVSSKPLTVEPISS